MPTKNHQPNKFEQDILAFLERRKGQVIDEALLSQFASYFWRKRVAFELFVMRGMRQ